jgi:adenylosuccinate synthase
MTRRVDVIVGMQWGSEGKGKIASALALNYAAAVRTGAPNAGHTVQLRGSKYVMRSVPCAWTNPDCQLFVGPAGMISQHVLAEELKQLPPSVLARLHFDRNVALIEHQDVEEEERTAMNAKVGSTAEGCGAALARKISRRSRVTIGQHFANDVPAGGVFDGRVVDVAVALNDIVDGGGSVMLEGTQGFGLCLNHGTYPYVTSRDILPSSLLSDAGLAPSLHRYTIGVMRVYPIRVAGNSGPMGDAKEITWAEVSERCGAPAGAIVEKTTVTKRVRRVSEIDWAFMRRSVMLQRPTGIFLTFADYIDWTAHGAKHYGDLSHKVVAFIERVQTELNVPVLGISTGPDQDEMVYTPEFAKYVPELSRPDAVAAGSR